MACLQGWPGRCTGCCRSTLTQACLWIVMPSGLWLRLGASNYYGLWLCKHFLHFHHSFCYYVSTISRPENLTKGNRWLSISFPMPGVRQTWCFSSHRHTAMYSLETSWKNKLQRKSMKSGIMAAEQQYHLSTTHYWTWCLARHKQCLRSCSKQLLSVRHCYSPKV